MSRHLTQLSFLMMLMIALAGCRMCASPYDYCGPVFNDGGPNCDPLHRVNSAFGSACCEKSYAEETIVGHHGSDIEPGRYTEPKKPAAGKKSGVPIGIPKNAPNGTTGRAMEIERGNDGYRAVDPNDYLIPPGAAPGRFPDAPSIQPETPSGSGDVPSPFGAPAAPPTGTMNRLQRDDVDFDLEEIRRSDPSITNIEILSVEDESENAELFPPRTSFKTEPITPPQTQAIGSSGSTDSPWQ